MSNDIKQGFANCPSGKQVLGGGWFPDYTNDKFWATASLAIQQSSEYPAWSAVMVNIGSVSRTFKVYAICANVTP